MAERLSNKHVNVVVIPDSVIFAMMSRVNKVIIGTNGILANGGLRATSGAYTVALAAKHYSVPVLVLAPMIKFSPVHLCSYELEAFNTLGCAESVLEHGSIAAQNTKIYNPIYDYVPPELVTAFISNT